MSEGTAIGEAVAASVAAAAEAATADGAEATPSSVVLLSDGSNTQGRSIESAAQVATAAGIPVYTIAYGTGGGAVSVQGQSVSVPVDTEALASLAASTGGTAYTAESDTALTDVYDDIGSQIGTTTETREVTPRWAGLALLAGVAGAALSLVWGTRLP